MKHQIRMFLFFPKDLSKFLISLGFAEVNSWKYGLQSSNLSRDDAIYTTQHRPQQNWTMKQVTKTTPFIDQNRWFVQKDVADRHSTFSNLQTKSGKRTLYFFVLLNTWQQSIKLADYKVYQFCGFQYYHSRQTRSV